MQQDPYFKLLKDYDSGNFMKRGALSQYWESMQRQYGTLKNVPQRDDPSFAKALEHRTREKQYYESLHRENDEMRRQMQLSTQTLQGLNAENSRLYDIISRFQEMQSTSNATPNSDRSDSSRRVHFDAEQDVQATGDERSRRPDERARPGEDHNTASEGDRPDEPEGSSGAA